jgi:hypothetical protein
MGFLDGAAKIKKVCALHNQSGSNAVFFKLFF